MTEIDTQIPYIQVHRNVARLAASLAPTLGVSYQHVRGGLDVFWESLADRRILAKALDLPDPMVVIDATETINRLWLAFGLKVDPSIMVAAGVLEALPAGKYRVRGMSRYIEMEAERRMEIDRARAGGRSRAVGARLASGRFMAGALAGEPPSHAPAVDQPSSSLTPAGDQVRGERREVRGETGEVRGDQSAPAAEKLKPSAVTPPTSDPVCWVGDDFWRWAEAKRQASGCPPQGPPHATKLSKWWSEALGLINGDVKAMQEAFYRFGEDKHWQGERPALPFGAFMAKWNDFLPVRRHAHA